MHGYDIPERLLDVYKHPGTAKVLERFDRGPAMYKAEDSDTAYIADKLLDYLRLRRKDDWFAHVVFLRPHPPLIAPAPYNMLVDAATVPAPVRNTSREAERAVHPFLDAWLTTQSDPAYFESQVNVQTLPEADLADMRAVYYGLIAEVDAQLGRIFTQLETTGELEETLIIFTADHGEMLGDHWCWGKAGWFEASNYIPLIIRDPRAAKQGRGRRVEAFTESVDLVPTILEWLGRDAPVEANGLSLMPWIKGQTPTEWRDAVFWEYDFRSPHTQKAETHFGLTSDQCTMNVLRDASYKYVHFTAQSPLLYDLTRDPGELTNIANDPAMAPVIARYAQKLLSHRMLHAERALANAQLTSQGVVQFTGPRGLVGRRAQ